MLPWLVGLLLLKEPRGSSLTCPSSSGNHGAPQRPPLQPECGQKSRMGVGRGTGSGLCQHRRREKGQVWGWGSGTHVLMQLLVQGGFVMITPLHPQPLDQWLDGQTLQTGRR